MTATIYAFDMVETLLDLSGLDSHFEQTFGDSAVRMSWFQQVLQLALVSVATDEYRDFATICRAALQMTAERQGITLSSDQQDNILQALRQLSPHPEVPAALRRLHQQGLEMVVLTNSSLEAATEVLVHSSLADMFARILSAGQAGQLKPGRRPYMFTAEQLGVMPADIMLVAAHSWDVAGAMRAGCQAAFVARPGMVLDPLSPQPSIVGAELNTVGDMILSRHSSR